MQGQDILLTALRLHPMVSRDLVHLVTVTLLPDPILFHHTTLQVLSMMVPIIRGFHPHTTVPTPITLIQEDGIPAKMSMSSHPTTNHQIQSIDRQLDKGDHTSPTINTLLLRLLAEVDKQHRLPD